MFPIETLVADVERVTYYNAENGYAVIKVRAEGRYPKAVAKDGTIAVVGYMPEFKAGERVEFRGSWIEDRKYGTQFKADISLPVPPSTREGLIAFLGSGVVKGIGPKSAEKIVSHFGDATLSILEKEPERIREVPGLKRELAQELIRRWPETQSVRNSLIYLQGYGISSRMAHRILDHYGTATVSKVREDPYQLADDVYGIGFMRADDIARAMGLPTDAPERIRAGLSYALQSMTLDGHTYAPRSILVTKAAELLKVENTARIEAVLAQQLFNDALISEKTRSQSIGDDAIYLPEYFTAETDVAHRIRKMTSSEKLTPVQRGLKATRWDALLRDLTVRNSVDLTRQQGDAVHAALKHPLSVLTGGPGTGKTTTLRMLIEALKTLDLPFALASPTGRAARRLAEATGHEARTLHRLLGFSPTEGGFSHDEESPLEVAMLIVDETSMLDLLLFDAVMRALPHDAHLVLVGDVDQLPSVGAGNVLKDIIASGVAHVTRLNTIFRQANHSFIVSNAHRINAGEMPVLDKASEDFYFFGAEDPEKAAELVVDVVVRKMPQKFGAHPLRDVQVISPMYRGPAGVNALNEALQAALNSGHQHAEVRFGQRVFRPNDRVMQTRNNYDKEVFNGDIGIITAVDIDDRRLDVTFDNLETYYEGDELDELILAYCISTHRSQGSEYSYVVMPVLSQHYMMLQRNLLYTAITRARKGVVLVGSRKAIYTAVNNNRVSERYSRLAERIAAQ